MTIPAKSRIVPADSSQFSVNACVDTGLPASVTTLSPGQSNFTVVALSASSTNGICWRENIRMMIR